MNVTNGSLNRTFSRRGVVVTSKFSETLHLSSLLSLNHFLFAASICSKDGFLKRVDKQTPMILHIISGKDLNFVIS